MLRAHTIIIRFILTLATVKHLKRALNMLYIHLKPGSTYVVSSPIPIYGQYRMQITNWPIYS